MKAENGRKVLAWDGTESSRCGPGEPCGQLHVGTAAVPLVLAPVCQTHSWLGHNAALSPAPMYSTCGGLKALTILFVESQTDFLLEDRPYFKLSKALHEVNIIQHWALVKGLDEAGCQPFSFVAGRS